MKDRDSEISEQCKKKSPAWDACTTTTATDRSLGSVAEKQWPSTLHRLLSAPRSRNNVRQTNGVNALISVPCRRSGRRRVRRRRAVLSHPAPRTLSMRMIPGISPPHQSARMKSSVQCKEGKSVTRKRSKPGLRLRRRLYFWHFQHLCIIARVAFRINSMLFYCAKKKKKSKDPSENNLISIIELYKKFS